VLKLKVNLNDIGLLQIKAIYFRSSGTCTKKLPSAHNTRGRVKTKEITNRTLEK